LHIIKSIKQSKIYIGHSQKKIKIDFLLKNRSKL